MMAMGEMFSTSRMESKLGKRLLRVRSREALPHVSRSRQHPWNLCLVKRIVFHFKSLWVTDGVFPLLVLGGLRCRFGWRAYTSENIIPSIFMLAFSCLSPLLLVKSILLIGSFILFLRPHTCALIAQTYKVIKGLISSAETLRKHICFFAPFHLKGFFSRSLKFIAFYPLNLSFNHRHTLLNFFYFFSL